MIHSLSLLIPFLAYTFLITSNTGCMPSFLRLSAIYPHPTNYLSSLMRLRLLPLISMADLNIFQTSSFTLSTMLLLRFWRRFVQTLSRVSNHPSVSSAEPQSLTLPSPATGPSSPVHLPACQAQPSPPALPWAVHLGSRDCSHPEGASSRDFSMLFLSQHWLQQSYFGLQDTDRIFQQAVKRETMFQAGTGYRLAAVWFFILPGGEHCCSAATLVWKYLVQLFLSFALVFCFKIRSEEEISHAFARWALLKCRRECHIEQIKHRPVLRSRYGGKSRKLNPLWQALVSKAERKDFSNPAIFPDPLEPVESLAQPIRQLNCLAVR